MAGILKVGGVPLATHSDSTAKVSLDTNVQFPAGPLISGQTSGGHILQVQQKAYTAAETTLGDTTDYQPVDSKVLITPSSTSSKILFMHTAGVITHRSAYNLSFRISRTISSSTTYIHTNQRGIGYIDSSASEWYPAPLSVYFVDSPNTTNEIEYGLEMAKGNTGSNTQVGHNTASGTSASNYNTAISIVMEIV